MNVSEIKIEEFKNGLNIYQSDKFKINEKINKFWNVKSEYENFLDFKTKNNYGNDFEALQELAKVNKNKEHCSLKLNNLITKSNPDKDFEMISVNFKDENEAKEYFDYLQKNLKLDSLYQDIKLVDNKIEVVYTRLSVSEKEQRTYRTKTKRLALSEMKDTAITSVNNNSLKIEQAIHNYNKNKILMYKYSDNVVKTITSNDTLTLNDKNVEDKKEQFLSILSQAKDEFKKDKNSKRGSNVVNTNLKNEIDTKQAPEDIKSEDNTNVASEVKESTTSGLGADEWLQIKQKASELKRNELVNNKDIILKTFDDYFKENGSFGDSIDRMNRSYKNDELQDFIIFHKNKDLNELNNLKKDNSKLENEVETKQENIIKLETNLNDVISKFEKNEVENANIINSLTNNIDELDNTNSRLSNSLNELTNAIV